MPPSNPQLPSTCVQITARGTACSRRVARGQRFCWQHARGWRSKVKALTGSQRIGLIVSVVLAILLFIVAPFYSQMIGKWFAGSPFSVEVGSVRVDTTRNPLNGEFWLRYQSDLGSTLTPLGTAMFLTVHNRRGHEVRVASYSVELQAKGQEWLKFHPVPIDAGAVFFASGDLRKASPLDFGENALAAIFRRRALSAYETVQGWVFLLPEHSYLCPPNGTSVRYPYARGFRFGKIHLDVTI